MDTIMKDKSMKKISLTILLTLVAVVPLRAQSGINIEDIKETSHKITMMVRCSGDSVVLRWGVSEPGIWMLSNQYGWNIERTNANSHVRLNGGAPVKPWSLEKMKAVFPASDIYAGALAQMLYSSTKVDQSLANKANTFFAYAYRQYQEHAQRQMIVSLLADYDAKLATAAGLRYVDYDVTPGELYEYTITSNIPAKYSNITGSSELVRIKPSDSAEVVPCPKPSVKAIDGSLVAVYWDRSAHSGYFLERKADSVWIKLNTWPVVSAKPDENAVRAFGTDVATLMQHNVVYLDSLQSGQKATYRLRAYDAFAEYSDYVESDEFEMPDRQAPVAPVLVSVKALGNKYCHIVWQKSPSADCKNYLLTFSNTSAGPWSKASDPIPAYSTSYDDSAAVSRGVGYYRLYAVDSVGNISYSNVVPNAIADTRYPSAPQNLKFSTRVLRAENSDKPQLATLGVVNLKWDAVNDADLLGYRVFFANQRDHQFMEASSGNIRSTQYSDTLNIQTTTPHIYYYIIAVDQHYNYSAPSDTVEVDVPDVVVPSGCSLASVSQVGNKVLVRWHKSATKDVDSYRVYGQVANSVNWTFLAKIDAQVFADSSFVEFSYVPQEAGTYYQYSIEAVDKAGNSSGRTGFAPLTYQNIKEVDIPITLKGKYKKKAGGVVLTWDYNYSSKVDYYGVIYRIVNGSAPKDITSFLHGEKTYVDTDVQRGVAKYYIVLKLGNGRESKPSPTASVTVK